MELVIKFLSFYEFVYEKKKTGFKQKITCRFGDNRFSEKLSF
jgi:hypothetical protein